MKKQKKKANVRLNTLLKRYLISAILALILSSAFWMQNAEDIVRSPKADTAAELYANQIHDDLTFTFRTAINNAEDSILLIVYSLTDQEIISCLKQKSEEGVNVKVICDAKASPYIDSKLGSKVSTIRRFGPGLMHQKILVIDNRQTWIGSANMTTESLQNHGNLVAGIESPELALEISEKSATLKIEGRDRSFPHTDFTIGNQPVELWFLPDNADAIERLKNLIDSAKKTIRIAMFTWTRQDLAQCVINAAKRGINTEVVIDHYSGKGASSKIAKLLKKQGVSVALSRGSSLLHHKFLYIDGKTLVNGSANWTKAAFTQNDDCFIVLHNLSEPQQTIMDNLWKTIHSSTLPVN